MQKRIPTKMESSEASTLFIKRKRVQYVWIGTWADSERVALSLEVKREQVCTHGRLLRQTKYRLRASRIEIIDLRKPGRNVP